MNGERSALPHPSRFGAIRFPGCWSGRAAAQQVAPSLASPRTLRPQSETGLIGFAFAHFPDVDLG